MEVQTRLAGGAVVQANGIAVAVRVTPRRSLVRTGVIASLVGGIPLFGVLYWLALEQGSWLRVLAIHLLVTAVGFVAWLRFRAGFTQVADGLITKQAFVTRTVVTSTDVVSTVIAQTYTAHSEPISQLIAFGADGERLFRMRGIYWRREDMILIAEAIGAPILYEPEPMTLREFYAAFPGAAYWYEGRPWLFVAGIIVALVGAFLIMSWLMMAIGAPSVLSIPL